MVARGPTPRRSPGRFGSRLKRSQRLAGYLFVLPTLALFLAFVGWPIVQTIIPELDQRWGGFGEKRFIGLDNYTRMLGDPVAQRALLMTLVFTAVTTVVQTVLGLLIAVLVNDGMALRGRRRPDDPVHPRHRLLRRLRCAVEADLRPEHRHPEPHTRRGRV